MTHNQTVFRVARSLSGGGVRLLMYACLVVAMLLSNSASAEYNWSSVKIGAGGFLTGMDIHSDGTHVVRTDTYGAYKWNATTSAWEQLVTVNSIPAADSGAGKSVQGVYELRIAATDSDIMYMAMAGFVYKTTNGGATWARTAFSQLDFGTSHNANNSLRLRGEKMAIDPANADVVYVGSELNGMFKTSDGGDTWSLDTGVAHVATPGVGGICFDSTSSVVGGKTQIIYATSGTDGVYRTANGGTSWTQISDGTGSPATPTAAIHVTCANGTYYITDAFQGNVSGYLWKYDGSWTDIEPGGTGGSRSMTIIVDPNNANRLVVGIDASNLRVSRDDGATWDDIVWTFLLSYTDIPWHVNPNNPTTLSNGAMAFDSAVEGKIWNSAGIGVWTLTLDTPGGSPDPMTWTEQSKGIEQLVANNVLAPPNESTIHFCSWDRGVFSLSDFETFPSSYGPDIVPLTINNCWAIASVATDTSNPLIVQTNQRSSDESASTTDRGATWNFLTDFMTQPGGSIAASTDTNWIAYTGGDKGAFYTADAGATWTAITDFGLNVQGSSGLNRNIVTCDTVTADKCWLYFTNRFDVNDADRGVWETTDGGVNWTHVFTGYIVSHNIDSFHATMRAVPGHEAHLFHTGGDVGTYSQASPAVGANFMRSTDGGANWTNANTALGEIHAFGFGNEQAGGYPSIFITGWVDSVYGIWRSDDTAATWTKIGDYPMGIYDQAYTIEGAKDGTNRVFVGFRGTGYAYGVPSGSSRPPPLPPVLLP